jgi:hypothetical protein
LSLSVSFAWSLPVSCVLSLSPYIGHPIAWQVRAHTPLELCVWVWVSVVRVCACVLCTLVGVFSV